MKYTNRLKLVNTQARLRENFFLVGGFGIASQVWFQSLGKQNYNTRQIVRKPSAGFFPEDFSTAAERHSAVRR
jgi:hypothetical protein